MPWLFVALVGGVVLLAHTAPFPFILDWMHPGVAVWRMPRGATPSVYLTFVSAKPVRFSPRFSPASALDK